MENLIRVVQAVHRVIPGDIKKNMDAAIKVINEAASIACDIVVLPALSLCGASCGDAFKNRALLAECSEALKDIAAATVNMNTYVIVGLPIMENGALVQVSAVLHTGNILGFVPAFMPAYGLTPYNPNLYSNLLHPDTLFYCGDLKFSIACCDPVRLPVYAASAANKGADLVINTCALPISVNKVAQCRRAARSFSQAFGCAVAVCNGNVGESGAPNLYRAFSGVFECGEKLAWQIHNHATFSINTDIDLDILRGDSYTADTVAKTHAISIHDLNAKKGLLREVRRNPFLPADFKDAVALTDEYFDLQVRALTAKLLNSRIKKVVIGCSGGLDSSLALLVSKAALDKLSLPEHHLIGVVMPGFGTTERTYNNAIQLLNLVHANIREISIAEAVKLHLNDIHHQIDNYNTTFENAQARERTQILLGIANDENALVVGTGDLSEIALGFSTFGGDALANYNVNAAIPKTMLQTMLPYLAQTPPFKALQDVLEDILNTPISPELLSGQGEDVHQHTESILGPYVLHDFFLYYFLKYHMSPAKILQYAEVAFEADYNHNFIKKTFIVFLKRFYLSGFKRVCSPESTAIGELHLGPQSFYIPSEYSEQDMLRMLELTDTLS